MRNTPSVFLLLFLAVVSCSKNNTLEQQDAKTVSVQSIVVSPDQLCLTVGEESALTVTINPTNASNKDIIWTSSNSKVATIDKGKVTAVSDGEAIITATSVDGGQKASCKVTVQEIFAAITGEATHISCRNAELSGKANLPNTISSDLKFGVLYSTSSGVLLSSSEQIEAEVFDSEYNYTISTKTLEPDTTYYYRSYISQKGEITYGNIKSFRTLSVSSLINTVDATDVHPKDVTLNAILDLNDCTYESIEYGFEYTTIEGVKTIKATNLSNKAYSVKVSGLEKANNYPCKAYVVLDGRKYEANEISFTTEAIKATIEMEFFDITEFNVIVSGSVTIESEGTFTTEAQLYYSKTSSTITDLKSSGSAIPLTLSDGTFTTALSSLDYASTYYCMVVCTIDGAEHNSKVMTFTTADFSAVLSLDDASPTVTVYSARISGTLTVKSIETLDKSITLYYSNSANTIEGLKSNGTRELLSINDNGSFSCLLSTLSYNTDYFYAVVANIQGREYVSDVKSFHTGDIVVSCFQDWIHSSEYWVDIDCYWIVNAVTDNKVFSIYYSRSENTIEALKSNGAKDIFTVVKDLGPSDYDASKYSCHLSDLAFASEYFYILVATIDGKDYTTEVKSFTTAGAVDLGLSVKWASLNLGARKKVASGLYFQWGDIQGFESDTSDGKQFSWSSYKWSNGSPFTLFKYISASSYYPVDNKAILEKSDDAASNALGGNWRIPTKEEWEELLNPDNCYSSRANINGVWGYLIKSKINGNEIFLPVTGSRHDTYYGYTTQAWYWSSSLMENSSHSNYAYVMQFGEDYLNIGGFKRCNGIPIRPVCD